MKIINRFEEMGTAQKATIAIVLILIAVFIALQPTITGNVTKTVQHTGHLDLNKEYYTNTTQDLDINEAITSLHISGRFKGEVKIYLISENSSISSAGNYTYIILDSAKYAKSANGSSSLITGLVTGLDTKENLTINDTLTSNNSLDTNYTATANNTVEPIISNDSVIVMPDENLNISRNLTISKNLISPENLTSSINTSADIYANLTANITDNYSVTITNNASDLVQNITQNITEATIDNVSGDYTENMTINRTSFNSSYVDFIDACAETCLFNAGPAYSLEIVLGNNSSVDITNITYSYSSEIRQIKDIPDIVYDKEYDLNLSEYFRSNTGNQGMLYDSVTPKYSNYTIDADIIRYYAKYNGTDRLKIYAVHDGELLMSNEFSLTSAVSAKNITMNITMNMTRLINTTMNIKKISAALLKELRDKNTTRVIIRSYKTLNVIKISNSSEISNSTNNTITIKLQGILSRMNKEYITNMSKDLEIMQDVGDMKSVIVDSETLAELSNLADVEEIIPDNEMNLLTQDSMTITEITNVQNAGFTGSGVKACIIDTGVNYTALNMTLGLNVFGFDAINQDNDPMDYTGHGTEVAYIFHTMAPGAIIYSAKVTDDSGIGYESDVLAGIEYCRENNVSIISMSMGSVLSPGYCDENIVAQAVDDAVAANISVIVASGNDGMSDQIRVPACAQNATRVAASTKQDGIAAFSDIFLNDLVAPGQGILTIDNSGSSIVMSGTSMSAPMIGAAVALIIQSRTEENTLLNPLEIRYLLRSTSDIIYYNDSYLNITLPVNRLNAYNALIQNITNTPYDYTMNATAANLTNQTNETYQTLAYTNYRTPNNVINSTIVPGLYVNFTNPPYAISFDNNYAASAMPVKGNTSRLNASNYTFSIPTDAVISGITVVIAHRSNGANILDREVYLMKSYTPVGNNKTNTNAWTANADQNITYGGATDLWGTTWTASDINSAGFGVIFSAKSTAANARTASINVIWINVTYNYDMINGSTNQSTYLAGQSVNVSGMYYWDNLSWIDNRNVTVRFINTTNAIVFWINVTTNGTGYYSANYTLPANIDEGTWSVNVTGVFSTTVNASNNMTFFAGIAPTVHLLVPLNQTSTANITMNFTCNITDNVATKNLTIFIWNSTNVLIYNQTRGLGGQGNTSNFTYTFTRGDTYNWNCLGYDTNGLGAWSTEGNYTLNISPVLTITYLQTLSAQDPLESGLKNITINFTVSSSAGNASIDISTANITLNLSSLNRSRYFCTGFAINVTAENISCNISLKFYDPPGIYSVNVSIKDTTGASTSNRTTTLTYNELSAIAISSSNMNLGSVGVNQQDFRLPDIVINNTGNSIFNNLSIKAYDLFNSTYSINTTSFQINTSNSNTGNVLLNNTFLNITGSALSRNNDTLNQNETFYIYLDVPGAPLPALYYKSLSEWIILANK